MLLQLDVWQSALSHCTVSTPLSLTKHFAAILQLWWYPRTTGDLQGGGHLESGSTYLQLISEYQKWFSLQRHATTLEFWSSKSLYPHSKWKYFYSCIKLFSMYYIPLFTICETIVSSGQERKLSDSRSIIPFLYWKRHFYQLWECKVSIPSTHLPPTPMFLSIVTCCYGGWSWEKIGIV